MTPFIYIYKHFSIPIGLKTQVLVIREPRPIDKFDQLLQTFGVEVWILIVASSIVVSISFKLIHYAYCTRCVPV